MAAVQCRSSKCTAERKGFRRELDSWRHKLIHCVGFESILEGIYGPMLLRDLNLFEDCEPEEVNDWSPEVSCSNCSFCNLPLDKLSEQVPVATSPLSSPSDYSPTQATTVSECNQLAHRFLQAVFHKKDVSMGSDSNIPLVAQELMKKMIHQFALEYASKSLLHTNTNGITSRASSPLSDTSDTPLDLTLSRSQEKNKELHPDGVLDLSKRTSACPAASTSALSPNHKDSGILPVSLEEELGGAGHRKAPSCHSSGLDAVLSSLCQAHRSLLYQILKLAHQEQLLSFPHCRAAGQSPGAVTPQDNGPTPFECKAHSSSPHYPFIDCHHQGHSSTMFHHGDVKSSCSNYHFPLNDGKGKAHRGCCCAHSCRVPAYPVFCLKNLHCASCQSLAVGHIGNMVRSFASSPSLSKSPSLCASSSHLCPAPSICCHQQNPHSCPCYSGHVCLTQARNSEKREQSPSPPPLSPIPSDISSKTEEKPPALLHHIQDEGEEPSLQLMVKDSHANTCPLNSPSNAASEQERRCSLSPTCGHAEQNPTGSLLQDVVDRFSEKLETITPLDKDSPLTPTSVLTTEEEEPQSPPTSQNLHFHGDAHLTEIITTVLHSGSNSDYNLSELFHRHDSKQPKSPNTRSRFRQKVLAAMSTPTDDASSRRHSLQIKRELAMLDQSYSRKKASPTKRAKVRNGGKLSSPASEGTLDTVMVKEECDKETQDLEMTAFGRHHILGNTENGKVVDDICIADNSEDHKTSEEHGQEECVQREREVDGRLSPLVASSGTDEVKEEVQAVIVTEDVHCVKTEEREMEIATEEIEPTPLCNKIPATASKICDIDHEGSASGESSNNGTGKDKDDCNSTREKHTVCPPSQGNLERDRRTRRNIVPPQRFSSYVTEPRKMYFVACFSEGIFNQREPKEKAVTCSRLDPSPETPNSSVHTGEPEQCETSNVQTDQTPAAVQEKNLTQSSCSQTEDRDVVVEPSKKLRKSPRKHHDSQLMPLSSLHQIVSSSEPPNPDKSTPCTMNTPISPTDYTSPIKLMYVLPVKEEGKVKYSLKSAGSGSATQAQVSFDPCEESSWAGTPDGNTESHFPTLKSSSSPLKVVTSSSKSATSPVTSVSSPPKSTSSPSKSASSPPKVASPSARCGSSPSKSVACPQKLVSSPGKSVPSPSKSASSPPKLSSSPTKPGSSPPKSDSSPPKSGSSPKSTSSPAKSNTRRSAEGTPPKNTLGMESTRLAADISSYECPPLKRRPGRPKKLGPQLENKVKRPIGRPRKQKPLDAPTEMDAVKGTSSLTSDRVDNVNKNLKITVVYGRSRRNKRTVSEGLGQLPSESHDGLQVADQNRDCPSSAQIPEVSSGLPVEGSKDLNLVRPVKECPNHSSSNIKCQKHDSALPVRKPGRPAKVKISGISVTVTTVSPRQRKIQINKDRQSAEAQSHKKSLLPAFKSAKEQRAISHQTSSGCGQTDKSSAESTEDGDRLSNQQVAVRHSMRVRKPSIYFLHSVATSRSFSRSTALLKRSKQLMLNKAMNERRDVAAQSTAETSRDRDRACGRGRHRVSQDLGQVAEVSLDSIFSPRDPPRWWLASAEERTLNQELARRIRVISDTWVSDSGENRDEGARAGVKSSGTSAKKRSSVVRILFDCPPNRPRSCSMQQLCSWFMQTTETQSLAIVKRASSRNPYEHMHFPRSSAKTLSCPSPQAERLRKHIKKFAKTVPKSPYQHRLAQRRLRKRNGILWATRHVRRQLFNPNVVQCCLHHGSRSVRGRAVLKYQTTLLRARRRFLTRRERSRWPKRPRRGETFARFGPAERGPRSKQHAPCGPAKQTLAGYLESSSDQTQETAEVPKDCDLSSKAWSPEKLKECRVFLRKINSPDGESVEEEWDSCTVTLDDGSPSAYQFVRGQGEMGGFVKAVNPETGRRKRRRTASGGALGSPAPKSAREQVNATARRQKGKRKRPGGGPNDALQPTPAKMLRQSRMRGLSGPRWCDFVFEN